jgi:hypothetical protein
MEIDKESIKNFEDQIDLLKSLKESIEGAIDRANDRLKLLKKGEPIEKVFELPPYAKP